MDSILTSTHVTTLIWLSFGFLILRRVADTVATVLIALAQHRAAAASPESTPFNGLDASGVDDQEPIFDFSDEDHAVLQRLRERIDPVHGEILNTPDLDEERALLDRLITSTASVL